MRIRSNPLIEYIDFSTEKDREIMDYASRPLYSKNAPTVFATKLEFVPLNIVIMLGKPVTKKEKEYIDTLVLDQKYVVLNKRKSFKAGATEKRSWGSTAWDMHFQRCTPRVCP